MQIKTCVCCGAQQVGTKFQYDDGTLSTITKDHIVLWSLTYKNKDNTNAMCERCNSLRANRFAEQDEFIDWFRSGVQELPVRNFSYLKEVPKEVFDNYPKRVQNKLKAYFKGEEVSEPKPTSQMTGEVTVNGVVYIEFTHPVYGKSLVMKGTL